MVWEQESRLIVSLSSIDSQECRPFWPAIIGEMLSWETNKRGDQMRLTLLEEADTLARRAIRLNLELVSPPYYYILPLDTKMRFEKDFISPVLGICWLLKKTKYKFVKLTLPTVHLLTFRLYHSHFEDSTLKPNLLEMSNIQFQNISTKCLKFTQQWQFSGNFILFYLFQFPRLLLVCSQVI